MRRSRNRSNRQAGRKIVEGGRGYELTSEGQLYVFNPEEIKVLREVEGGETPLDTIAMLSETVIVSIGPGAEPPERE